MRITALYAAPLALLFLVLSVRVIQRRRSGQVALGDGGDGLLLRRMRVHANFSEYVPLALILLGLAESLSAPTLLLHGGGIALLAGRVCHAVGVSRAQEDFRLRVVGIALTISVIASLAVAIFALALR
jgi:uncharacterized membrane protein YecN with MAPEG domain